MAPNCKGWRHWWERIQRHYNRHGVCWLRVVFVCVHFTFDWSVWRAFVHRVLLLELVQIRCSGRIEEFATQWADVPSPVNPHQDNSPCSCARHIQSNAHTHRHPPSLLPDHAAWCRHTHAHSVLCPFAAMICVCAPLLTAAVLSFFFFSIPKPNSHTCLLSDALWRSLWYRRLVYVCVAICMHRQTEWERENSESEKERIKQSPTTAAPSTQCGGGVVAPSTPYAMYMSEWRGGMVGRHDSPSPSQRPPPRVVSVPGGQWAQSWAAAGKAVSAAEDRAAATSRGSSVRADLTISARTSRESTTTTIERVCVSVFRRTSATDSIQTIQQRREQSNNNRDNWQDPVSCVQQHQNEDSGSIQQSINGR